MKKTFAILSIVLLLLVVPTYAFFHNHIQSWWEELTGEIEEELERSRVGRELNRIIEDIEGVTEIVNEIQSLASLVTSASPPLALANLAIQYGHNPDSVLPRFQERVHSLESNYNNGQSLSENEIAAALQSVLEEPPLPDGVYMGDNCLVDLRNCPQVNSGGHVYRGSYYAHSCYLDGVVSKKKSGGLNKAACGVNIVDAWSRGQIDIRFFADTQYATYDWERCSIALLTEDEKNQFLASRDQVCDQPIGNYDLGSVCVVDYTSCGYGAGGEYNANRIGTINYNTRDWYICEVANGNYKLNSQNRDSCITIYAGERELEEFMASHPEPNRTVTQVQPQQQGEFTQTNLAQVFQTLQRMNTTRDTLVTQLNDIPSNVQEPEELIVYGRNGTLDITPPTIQERKEMIEAKLKKFLSLPELNVDEIKSLVIGKEVPAAAKKIFSNERAEITIRRNYGKDVLFCAVVSNGVVTDFNLCPEDLSFRPTIKVQVSQSALETIRSADDAVAALEDGRISYKAVGLWNKLKFGASIKLFRSFAKKD